MEAPQISGPITISPTSINTTNSNQVVQVTVPATDNLSGIYTITAYFNHADGIMRAVWLSQNELQSGTLLNGVFTGGVTFPQYGRSGPYPLNNISMCDKAGNCRNYSRQQLADLGIDTGVGVNPPSISCEVLQDSWNDSNPFVHCSATDSESSLADPSDSSFYLATSVPSGSETSNAHTGTRQVCNLLGVCATAGPISGIKVDRKAPSISISGPLDGSVFHQGNSVLADFSCSDGGSGVATCVGVVADGDPVDTSALGVHSFTVTSTDAVGNQSNKTVHYTVVPVPPVGSPDLQISKTVSPAYARPGDTVTFTLVAKNAGTAAADDVVITDPLPAGVTFVSATSPCAFVTGTVTCEIGTLGPGDQKAYAVTVTVDPWGTADEDANHQLDVQKVEIQVDLDPGQTRTVETTCPSGYLVVDGSLRVDHIDQGTGDWTAPEVLESRASSAGTWRATVRNTATGRAQAKLFAVCVQKKTVLDGTHQHDLVLSDPVVVDEDIHSGTSTHTLECGPGEVAVQPGFASSPAGHLVYSQPEANGWKFVFESGSDTHLNFSIACLKRQTSLNQSHSHDLNFQRISTEVEVGPGTVNEAQLTCPDGSKGIVAGWDLDHGLVSLGNDPRPVTRAFKLYNPTDHTLKARLSLLCLGATTAGEHAGAIFFNNTAVISTPTIESDSDNNDSTVTLPGEDTDNHNPVTNDPNPTKPHPNNPIAKTIVGKGVSYSASGVTFTLKCSGACGGTAKLTSIKKVKVGGKKYGKGTVLAARQYFVGKAGTRKVTLRLTDAGRKIIKSGKSKKALLRISGGTRKVVKVGRR